MKRNPADADMQMIAKWKATGEQPSAEGLANLLLDVICLYHENYGEPGSEVPVQMELLELIGERILGKIAWAHAQNRTKVLAAKTHRLELQAKAKKVHEKYPNLKKSHRATAEKIVELQGGNINTIRKALAKK
jgi:hypothetical protein